MKDYSFGNYICALRTRLGLSQFQLGALVGVTDKAVSKWENGDSKPRISTCHRLAEVFGITLNELLSCEQYITTPARKELDKMNQKLWKQAYERLSIYGSNPPAACWSRLAAEETALHGTDAVQCFAALGKIQEAAQEAGAVITVTGDIKSSYAAWLFGATKVNPMQPHYRCPMCGKTEFVPDIADGFDLPDRECSCGAHLLGDGHNIPFDAYAKAQQRESWIEIRVSERFRPSAINALTDFYSGTAEVIPVKMLGETPGEDVDVYVVLPGNRVKPRLSEDGFWHVTIEDFWHWREGETAFVFHSSKQLDKLEAFRNTDSISLTLPEVFSPATINRIYQARHAQFPDITEKISSDETLDFDLLMRIDGFARGSWAYSNGSAIIGELEAPFRELPAFREDVWNDIERALTSKGIQENGLALMIAEMARMGKFFSKGIPDDIKQLLISLELPQWYLEYLSKTMYLFPKGHCVAVLINEMLMARYENILE